MMSQELELFVQQGGSAALLKAEQLVAASGLTMRHFTNGEQLVSSIRPDIPTVVVFDAILPDSTAYQLTKRMVSISLTVIPVVIINATDARTAVRFLRQENIVVIPDDSDQVEIWEMLTYAKQKAVDLAEYRRRHKIWLKRLDRCTLAERQVLKLWAEGQSNKQMTRRLDIAPRTLQLRKRAILEKLESTNLFSVIRELNKLQLESIYGENSDYTAASTE